MFHNEEIFIPKHVVHVLVFLSEFDQWQEKTTAIKQHKPLGIYRIG